MESSNILIIGGGIVGLATAYNLMQRHPDKTLILLEKENALALHQTGHNSGVLHSGIYYKPGSQKAQLCRQGKLAMQAFCEQENIPYEICGKVIVATNEMELESLYQIAERGQKNGVQCELIDKHRLLELEPHVAGIEAIHVRESGIVNFRQVCFRLAELIENEGHQILTGTTVTGLREDEHGVTVTTTASNFRADYVVTCAGLHADRIAAMAGVDLSIRIVPFRGEYFKLTPSAEHLCHSLIYPVPDIRFPFLGVHFTKMIDGGVECGPNAVLAFAREGYQLHNISVRDLVENLTYTGFRRLIGRYWRVGLGEMWRSLSKGAFVRGLQRLVPAISSDDLVPAPAGVRAQVVMPDGRLLDDFAFHESRRIVHVINAPSPAATASLSIGRTIAARLGQRFA